MIAIAVPVVGWDNTLDMPAGLNLYLIYHDRPSFSALYLLLVRLVGVGNKVRNNSRAVTS